jgi:hypothetical protein
LATNEQDTPHQYINEGSSATTQQRTDLQDSFGFDEDEEHAATDRLLIHQQPEDEDEEEDDDDSIIEIVRPTQTSIANHSRNGQSAVLPVSNDGVFANMSAKPESESKKLDETPPVCLKSYH